MLDRRKMIIIILTAAIILVAAIVVFIMFRRNRYVEFISRPEFTEQEFTGYVKTDEYTELLGMFDSEDEARKAAELYGIELQTFSSGLAKFHVSNDVDIDSLLEKGRKNGWPELDYNHIRHID